MSDRLRIIIGAMALSLLVRAGFALTGNSIASDVAFGWSFGALVAVIVGTLVSDKVRMMIWRRGYKASLPRSLEISNFAASLAKWDDRDAAEELAFRYTREDLVAAAAWAGNQRRKGRVDASVAIHVARLIEMATDGR